MNHKLTHVQANKQNYLISNTHTCIYLVLIQAHIQALIQDARTNRSLAHTLTQTHTQARTDGGVTEPIQPNKQQQPVAATEHQAQRTPSHRPDLGPAAGRFQYHTVSVHISRKKILLYVPPTT